MEHKEFKRINGNTAYAVLFIHGIVGTPNQFDMFLSSVPDTVSVYNMLLDGHGKNAKDFAKTSMKKWEQQVQATIDELSQSHENIYVVAHSMGTLLAIEQAVNNNKIAKLFLLAVPLKLFLKPKMVTNAWKVYSNRIHPDDLDAIAARNSCGIEQSKNPLHYIGWIPRYFELFAKIRQTRKSLHLLKTPCIAFQSCKDEMVSPKSADCLKENTCISVFELKDSGHYCYGKADLQYLLHEFKRFIKENITD